MTSSEIAVGLILARQRQGFGSRHRDQDLESLVAREIAEDASIMRIVFNDQQDGVALFERVAIVFDPRFLLRARQR